MATSLLERALAALPEREVVVDDLNRSLTGGELPAALAAERAWLARHGVERCAIAADNGVGWVVADLALHLARHVSVPLPPAFTPAQRAHALADAGVDSILIDERAPTDWPPGYALVGDIAPGSGLRMLQRPQQARRASLPDGTSKITYTSGSTGAPRGVCLSALHLETVAQSLVDATAPLALRRHLCLLPLATLLENVAGVLAPLLAGARCIVPPPALTGIGPAGLGVPQLLTMLTQQLPDSIILVPELLRLLVGATAQGWSPPASLRFVAVGGAVVAPALLARAIECGLPVYEGYGLSECCSVVCLNTPGASRVGSVGRVLPHARVRVDTHGEIHVRGATMLGYVGDVARPVGASLATGDLGQIDADGYLYVLGRQRNVFITSFGRNVSPEWVEAEIALEPGVAQVLVHGEGRPYAVALIVPTRPDLDAGAIHQAVTAANSRLPSYAQVRQWLRVPPFSACEGLATANGRLRRDAIERHYRDTLSSLYVDALAS